MYVHTYKSLDIQTPPEKFSGPLKHTIHAEPHDLFRVSIGQASAKQRKFASPQAMVMQKSNPVFHFTSWLIAILKMAYYNPYITSVVFQPLYNSTNREMNNPLCPFAILNTALLITLDLL